MANTTSTGLGFRLELRGDVWVVQYDTRGCHPANPDEIKLWLALEAAEAELTRRDTEPSNAAVTAFCNTYHGKGFEFPDPGRVAVALRAALAAAPVSLEAAKAEPHDHEFEDRCYCGLTAADHFAEGDNRG